MKTRRVVLLHTFHSHFIIISEASVGTWCEMDAFVLFHTELSIYYWSLKSQLSPSKDSTIDSISYESRADGVFGGVFPSHICYLI